jgi:hypothetical protein
VRESCLESSNTSIGTSHLAAKFSHFSPTNSDVSRISISSMEWRNVERLSLPLLRRRFEGRDVRKAKAHFEIGRLVPSPYMQLFPNDPQKTMKTF